LTIKYISFKKREENTLWSIYARFFIIIASFFCIYGKCRATNYKEFYVELESEIQRHIQALSSQEQYELGISMRKGEVLLPENIGLLQQDSLKSLRAQKCCFRSVIASVPYGEELHNKALHSLGMVSLQVLALEDAIDFFRRSNLLHSERNLERIQSIKDKFKFNDIKGGYEQEVICRELIKNKSFKPVKISREEANLFKFSTIQLEDLFNVAHQVLRAVNTEETSLIIAIGRSPFWVAKAVERLLPQYRNVSIKHLAFSRARRLSEPEFGWESESGVSEFLSYNRYITKTLGDLTSIQRIYILDYVGLGYAVWNFTERLLGAYIDPSDNKVSLLEGKINLIALKKSNVFLPISESEKQISGQIYFRAFKHIHDIELPSSLYIHIKKTPFYRFIEMPYLGFYHYEWTAERVSELPLETEIPLIRLEQIREFNLQER
jgi:hypothetical protein